MANTNVQKELCKKIEELLLFTKKEAEKHILNVTHYKQYAETILILTEALKNVSESELKD
ncbi:hypothetical protein [Pseudoruminococcus massiliensis]|uniref:hypothetical protein n=1 Tax=Pseudoruminococcus massiliensis TaxID=2086583 RepID=UPI0022E29EE1|nr:hypothetical protein [Pseudoruminococcus massiliensis]